MADIEKVIEGLDCCCEKQNCKGCPYFKFNASCQDDMNKDALDLLKEQKEYIEHLEEMNEKYGYINIVRCKDCIFWHECENNKGYGDCGQANGITLKPDDWFCADGVRKDEIE